jgi:hypothetical protein
VRGDTLWDISDSYLGTPWVWPSIWEDNPEVPNPHRIYPGDRIWISATSMRRVTDAEAAELLGRQDVPASEDAGLSTADALDVSRIESVGFVSAESLAAAGSVLGSPRDEKNLAAELPVYLSLGEGQVAVGDRFTVVRAKAEVRDPQTERVIGVFVDRLGWVEVTRVHAESAEAVIRVSSDSIQRGDRILPRVESGSTIALRETQPVEGQVAFFPDLRTTMGQHDVVFLNRGADHGLAVGSTLEVFRPEQRVRDEETGLRRSLPAHVVANLVVVSAEPTTAVAYVTGANAEIERGDRFRAASAPASIVE